MVDYDSLKGFVKKLAIEVSASPNVQQLVNKNGDIFPNVSQVEEYVKARRIAFQHRNKRSDRYRHLQDEAVIEELNAIQDDLRRINSAKVERGGNIKSITLIGTHPTRDLSVEHPDHQFYLANGVLTSNSHATGYAMISYQCAYLMTYFESEWLCSYLESMSSNENKRAKAFSEVRSLGYKIVPIDINEANEGWTILEGKRFMPSFTSCKGVGSVAVDEIKSARPYKSFEDVLWNKDGSWKHSKFNKLALAALVNIGAFESLDCVGEGKLFDSYAHMYEVLFGSYQEEVTRKRKGVEETVTMKREHLTLIKKSTAKNPHEGRKNFYEIVRRVREEGIEPWDRRNKALKNIAHFGSLDVSNLIDPKVLEIFDKKGLLSIDEFEDENVYWFCIVKIEPKTTRNGKKYLLLQVQGPAGKAYRMYCWGWDGKRQLELFSVCFAQLNKTDFGFATSIIKLRELE